MEQAKQSEVQAIISSMDRVQKTHDGHWGGGWRTDALAETLSLQEVLRAHQDVVGGEFDHLSDMLSDARQRAEDTSRGFRTWLHGGEIQHVWHDLNLVEQRLVELLAHDEHTRSWSAATAEQHLPALPRKKAAVEPSRML